MLEFFAAYTESFYVISQAQGQCFEFLLPIDDYEAALVHT